ncbi:LysM peptidoglycan-binding domain-containing protein [Jeongeupia sp. HS-3]|uniref:LysM peptidoglycan-binding domain-containing protein n=1 Tax=Jeongeupia sp. HS-3 TaxID=1009682 RepID=UPI001910B45D|nr:LysM peptidoglycan-binding domain-containing protein [Jeongeupia sp. HS-3]
MRKTIISLLLALGVGVGSVQADTLALQSNAPERYVVVKGDTLWGISGHFLKQPWRWPEIWQMNKDEIKNPHWIYPGDVVVLDRSGDTPRLKLLKSNKVSNRGVVKLAPRVRSSGFEDGAAAPSIPYAAIEPFLNKPLVIDPDSFKASPRIAAGPDSRVMFATGDRIYAVDLQGEPGDTWQAYRPGKPLTDPDDPDGKRVIGYQVDYLGDVRMEKEGDVATLRVVSAKEEIGVGSRLIRAADAPFINYVPHAPQQALEGRVVSAYGGIVEAGQYTTVVINRGSDAGVDIGTVLSTYKRGRAIVKEQQAEPSRVTPPEKSSNVFVYRVFPQFSYGLLLDSTLPVNVGDDVKSPN